MSTTTAPAPTSPRRSRSARSKVERKGNILVKWITSTDHKTIGYLYLITSFVFFCIGGVMALIIRAELFEPGMEIVQTHEQYNQLFTMHGTIMLLMFATPLFAGFANVIMPLQIGAPDVAFPRLNALAYWMFNFGRLIAVAGFFTPQGAASFGWFAYAPLSTTFSPGIGGDLWMLRPRPLRLRHHPRRRQLHHHDHHHARPGHDDVPDADLHLEHPGDVDPGADGLPAAARRRVRRSARTAASVPTSTTPRTGRAILWQHLFWFFGHPEVYIIALPFFGIVSEIFPVFSRKPIFGYKALVYATIAIAALSVTVWAHHMYVTGSVLLPFFALMTMLIAVPTGVKIFNWIGTMWRGSITFETPMLGDRLPGHLPLRRSDRHHPGFAAARLPRVRHLLRRRPLPLRGLRHRGVRDVRGLLLLVAQVDRQDAERALGQVALLAALHRLPHDVPHPALARRRGMPRRYADYLPEDDFTWMNQLSTIGAFILAASILPFFLNVYITARRARRSPSTTRGATAARSSGPPAARRRGTTSRRCRASARSARRST